MGHFDCPIPACSAVLMQIAPLFFHSGHPERKREVGYKSTHSSLRHFGKAQKRNIVCPTHLPLLVSIISNSKRDASTQMEEALNFKLALRQLQEATQAKPQLEQRLALKLAGLAKDFEDQ